MIYARQATWMLLLISACFHPTYDHPTCGPNGECPNGLTCSELRSCEAPGAGSPDAANSDAASPDASGSLQCPANYNVATLPGPSRYRLIIDGHKAWEQSDDCNKDQPGATHLVVIETLQEFTDIVAFVKNPGIGVASDSIWIGAVQRPTATSPSDAWLGFDGQPLYAGWGGSDPNDNDGNESQHQEQFVRMAKTAAYFIDNSGSDYYGALCECDGKSIDASVATIIDGYRN